MKQILQKNITFFLLSFNILHAQQTIPVLYAPCENCNSGNHDENNHNFQYGAIREFDTEHVTSDSDSKYLRLAMEIEFSQKKKMKVPIWIYFSR